MNRRPVVLGDGVPLGGPDDTAVFDAPGWPPPPDGPFDDPPPGGGGGGGGVPLRIHAPPGRVARPEGYSVQYAAVTQDGDGESIDGPPDGRDLQAAVTGDYADRQTAVMAGYWRSERAAPGWVTHVLVHDQDGCEVARYPVRRAG